MNPIAYLFFLLFAATVSAQSCDIQYVCFAIDMSGSFRSHEYDEQIAAVIKVARAIGDRATGSVSYSAQGFGSRVKSIQGPTTDLESVLIPQLRSASQSGGFTYTQLGLDACFQPMKGMSGNRVIVLSTDGNPVPSANRALTSNKAAEIKQNGVDIVAVGIKTTGLTGGLSKAYMQTLATSPEYYIETGVSEVVSNAIKITNQICSVPGGVGDPHILGFNGQRFDFHGTHNTHFSFFGRKNGDLTVATVHAVRAFQNGRMSDLTYFREFGFQPAGSSDKVRVVMLPCPSTGKWALEVSVNDVAMSGNGITTKVFKIEKATSSKLSVTTSDATYGIKMMWVEKGEKAHLNINVRLNRAPESTDEYHGVLGLTLNTGAEKLADIAPVAREAMLVQRFKEDSLFPKWETGPMPVSIVRSLSNVVSSAE